MHRVSPSVGSTVCGRCAEVHRPPLQVPWRQQASGVSSGTAGHRDAWYGASITTGPRRTLHVGPSDRRVCRYPLMGHEGRSMFGTTRRTGDPTTLLTAIGTALKVVS